MIATARALLRLARRSIFKAPLRSLLVVGLIALLVSAGTAFSAVIGTITQDTQSQFRNELGDSSTMISFGSDRSLDFFWNGTQSAVTVTTNGFEDVDPTALQSGAAVADYDAEIAELQQQLDIDFTSLRSGSIPLADEAIGPFGNRYAVPLLVDIGRHDPIANGNLTLSRGRLPTSSSEVAISAQAAYQLGLDVGDNRVHADSERTIVGIVANSSAGPVELVTTQAWESAANVSTPRWGAVRIFIDESLSRSEMAEALTTVENLTDQSVIALTPDENFRIGSTGELQSRVAPVESRSLAVRVISILLTVAVGVQISLVAASAFAVAIRRRTREFGQLVSTGADTSHIQRLVLAEAALLGALGAAIGVVLGVLVAGRIARFGLFSDAPTFGAPLQLTTLDVVAPVVIGILASLLAAWLPARTIAKAPATATLAGRLPLASLRTVTPLRGLIVLGLGTLGFAVLAVELTGSSNSDTGATLVLIVAACSILAMFGGALMLIGPLLAWVGQHADQFPLFARLIARDSDRHRGRSWMVIGAFIAAIAVPVIFGASIKAYPSSWATTAEAPLDGQLLSMRTASRWLWSEPIAAENAAQQPTLAALDTEIGAAAAEVVGPLASAQILDVPAFDLVTNFGGGYGSNGITLLVATPDMIELLELPTDLVDRLDSDTVVDLRHWRRAERNASYSITDTLSNTDTLGEGGLWPVELIDGPAMFSSLVLVSEELVGSVGASPRTAGTIYRAEEVLSAADEQRIMSDANEIWTRYRDDLASGPAPLPVELFVERQPDRGPSAETTRAWVIGVTALVATLIALITAALAAVEVDRDMRSMVAMGAAPTTRRVMLGGQTLYHLLIAAGIGIPLAILTFWAAARADTNGPAGPTFPWESMAMMGLVVPVVVAAVVALVFRNAKPAVSRRAS